jgi:hypothetical protein
LSIPKEHWRLVSSQKHIIAREYDVSINWHSTEICCVRIAGIGAKVYAATKAIGELLCCADVRKKINLKFVIRLFFEAIPVFKFLGLLSLFCVF